MQLFNRKTETRDFAEQPSPAASQFEIVSAKIASVKPSALSAVEAKVTKLRERRAQLGTDLAKMSTAALAEIQRHGKPPTEYQEIGQLIAALDRDELRPAREKLLRLRAEFAQGEFPRAANEIRAQAVAKIKQHLPDLIAAFHVLDALDNVAMRNGVEYRSGGAEMRVALQYLNSLVPAA